MLLDNRLMRRQRSSALWRVTVEKHAHAAPNRQRRRAVLSANWHPAQPTEPNILCRDRPYLCPYLRSISRDRGVWIDRSAKQLYRAGDPNGYWYLEHARLRACQS